MLEGWGCRVVYKGPAGNKKGEGCMCLHLFTTGNITRHSLAVVYCVY